MSRSALRLLRKSLRDAAQASGKYGVYCLSGRYSSEGYATEVEAQEALAKLHATCEVWVARN